MARTKKLNLAKAVTTNSPIFSGIVTGSITGNAATVTTNANLTGAVTSVGNVTTAYLQNLSNVNILESYPTSNAVLSYNSTTEEWEDAYEVGDPYIFGNQQLVLNNSQGWANVGKLRLNNPPPNDPNDPGPFYTQVNPAPNPVANVSFVFPNATGVIATNNTCLMLTGAQDVNGAKQFNQEIICSAAPSGSSSLMNRQYSDERYGTISDITIAPVSISNSTTFVSIVSITLNEGHYQLDAFLASTHGSVGGCKIRLGVTNPNFGQDNIKCGLSDCFGRPSVASLMVPIVGNNYNSSDAEAIRTDTGAALFSRNITGIFQVNYPNTTISIDYAQAVSSGTASIARIRAHIIARTINNP